MKSPYRGFARLAALALVIAGCSAGSSPGSSSSLVDSVTQDGGAQDGGSCHYPAGVEPVSASSSSGCFGEPPGKSCVVSNGATILADGGVSGGTASCQSQCGPSQYEMLCMGTGMPDSIPDPLASLGCTAIVEPTPSNALFYCCPCAE